MDDGWYKRLRDCRRKKGYTLAEMQGMDKLDLSQQSLIKYEKGEIFPRIDTLEKMCKIYGTTINYILYGEDKIAPFEDRSNSLITLFMLLHANKITFNRKEGTLEIIDPRLRLQITAIDYYRESVDISSIEDLERLIKDIKKIESEIR